MIGDPTPQTILELCTLKYWNIAERMLAGNPDLVRRFQDAYGRFLLSSLVDAAVEQDQVALAWPIIRQVVLPTQAVWLAHKTDLNLDRSDAYTSAQQFFFEGKIKSGVVNAKSGWRECIGREHPARKARAEQHAIGQIEHHTIVLFIVIPTPVIVRFNPHFSPVLFHFYL